MNINPYLWYGNRELPFLPDHFIPSTTLLTDQSREWLDKNCNGRYAFSDNQNKDVIGEDSGWQHITIFWLKNKVYFEDTRDLVHYELIWSGS